MSSDTDPDVITAMSELVRLKKAGKLNQLKHHRKTKEAKEIRAINRGVTLPCAFYTTGPVFERLEAWASMNETSIGHIIHIALSEYFDRQIRGMQRED